MRLVVVPKSDPKCQFKGKCPFREAILSGDRRNLRSECGSCNYEPLYKLLPSVPSDLAYYAGYGYKVYKTFEAVKFVEVDV